MELMIGFLMENHVTVRLIDLVNTETSVTRLFIVTTYEVIQVTLVHAVTCYFWNACQPIKARGFVGVFT